MQQRNLRVVDHRAVAIPAEDPSHADHAERVELRGPQRAHRCAAEDRHAGVERIEDLVVPDAGLRFEHAVDQRDCARAELERPPDIALTRRWQHGEAARGARRKRRPEERDLHSSSETRSSGA